MNELYTQVHFFAGVAAGTAVQGADAEAPGHSYEAVRSDFEAAVQVRIYVCACLEVWDWWLRLSLGVVGGGYRFGYWLGMSSISRRPCRYVCMRCGWGAFVGCGGLLAASWSVGWMGVSSFVLCGGLGDVVCARYPRSAHMEGRSTDACL
jgi:hypothetical protein